MRTQPTRHDPETAFYAAECECGHPRKAHEVDGDYDEDRWQGYWGCCEVPGCRCEKFEEGES